MKKQYKNITEVSKILNIKEHVIRHWDSIDPKTNKLRFSGLSTRSKGGTRYFNEENIKKIEQIKSLLFENGKHNYSFDLVNKIINSKNNKQNLKFSNKENKLSNVKAIVNNDYDRLNNILIKLRKLDES